MSVSTDTILKKTPLTEWHRAHGAQLVDFAGWEMPVSYTGIIQEHLAVRERAGLFDISHMGRFFVRGAGAEDFLQRMLTNDLKRLKPGQGQYTLALNETGGIRDDLIVFRLEGEFLVVMNASNRTKILDHFRVHAGSEAEIVHKSDELAMVALQGPRSGEVMGQLVPEAGALARFAIRRLTLAGKEMWISRTGYTGEDGFELYPESQDVVKVWEALLEAGGGLPVISCGLGARDGLRLEVGYPLYGHEIDETTTPWEAGLGWVVRMDKANFLGRAAIAASKERGLQRHLVGFTCAGPGVPRQGCQLTLNGTVVGAVTSGTYSPMLKTGIGFGLLRGAGELRDPLAVVVRNRPLPVVQVKFPFYTSGSVRIVGKT